MVTCSAGLLALESSVGGGGVYAPGIFVKGCSLFVLWSTVCCGSVGEELSRDSHVAVSQVRWCLDMPFQNYHYFFFLEPGC